MFENDFDIKDLCSAMFSDNLDRLGYRHNVASGFHRNHQFVRFIGRVRTVLIELTDTDDENLAEGLHFFEKLGKGDVLVVSGNGPYAYFGQMMSRLCMRQGIEGVIIDGMTRDSLFTNSEECPLPILSRGYTPVDIKGRGRVKMVDVPIVVEGIEVTPGNLVFADTEAACFVPPCCEEAMKKAIHNEIREEEKRVALINRMATVDEIMAQVRTF